jgi:hypothetical protein
VFFAALFAVFGMEVLCTGNPLLVNFPVRLIGIPPTAAVYTPLTYFPLWIVRRRVKAHGSIILFLLLVEISVITLTTFGSGG